MLLMSNGLNGDCIAEVCQKAGIKVKIIPMDKKVLKDTLESCKDIRGVFVVHCETSTGKVNPINEIGEVVKSYSKGRICVNFKRCLVLLGRSKQYTSAQLGNAKTSILRWCYLKTLT